MEGRGFLGAMLTSVSLLSLPWRSTPFPFFSGGNDSELSCRAFVSRIMPTCMASAASFFVFGEGIDCRSVAAFVASSGGEAIVAPVHVASRGGTRQGCNITLTDALRQDGRVMRWLIEEEFPKCTVVCRW